MSTASITRQHAIPVPRTSRPRTNPWQRVLALFALVPAVFGASSLIAAIVNSTGDIAENVEVAVGAWMFGVAGGFALLWLVVAAINWQIREAARARA